MGGLQTLLFYQTEHDTIEVIAYLKKEDSTKETELSRLKRVVSDLRTEAHKDKEALAEEYSQRIAQLEATLSERDEEVILCSLLILPPSPSLLPSLRDDLGINVELLPPLHYNLGMLFYSLFFVPPFSFSSSLLPLLSSHHVCPSSSPLCVT